MEEVASKCKTRTDFFERIESLEGLVTLGTNYQVKLDSHPLVDARELYQQRYKVSSLRGSTKDVERQGG